MKVAVVGGSLLSLGGFLAGCGGGGGGGGSGGCSSGQKLYTKSDNTTYCAVDCTGKISNCDTTENPPEGATSCPPDLKCAQCADSYGLAYDVKSYEPTGQCVFKCTDFQQYCGCYDQHCNPDGMSCDQCVAGYMPNPDFKGDKTGVVCPGLTTGITTQSETVRRLGAPASDVTLEAKAQVGDPPPDNGPCQHAVHGRWKAHPTWPFAAKMSFFMYRAQEEKSYPPENVDLASAGGVLWYIHNEIIDRKMSCQCEPPQGSEPADTPPCHHRHYRVTKILRFNVTVWNSVRSGFSNLGQFVQFDSGRCTLADCKDGARWKKSGFEVGCQRTPKVGGSDQSPADYGPKSIWFSLPGRCPSLTYNDPGKQACADSGEFPQRGGNWCGSFDPAQKHPVNGTDECTWSVEEAGSVEVDELSGITDHKQWCSEGNYEYDNVADAGKGTDFWNGKHDPAKNLERIHKMRAAFAKKYPEMENGSPDPICDTTY